MIYSHLATYYDKIMWHVEYKEWANLINKVAKIYIPNKSVSIFEIGGGTGTLGSLLSTTGFCYTGSDLSFSMAAESLKKDLPFICTDGRFLPLKTKFDLIIFLYDGINYLQSLQEYTDLFSSVYSSLNTNGLFLFDITTETNSTRYFLDYFSCDEYDTTTVLRHSYYRDDRKQQLNDFTIFSPDKKHPSLFNKLQENHVQYIFSPKEIENTIPKDKFRTMGIWDDFSMLRYTKHSERIHFLIQKL